MSESTRLVIIGGGPAGNSAASRAARMGADVTVVESDLIGGAAHLRDCIPSKTMVATGEVLSTVRRASELGLYVSPGEAGIAWDRLLDRMREISGTLEAKTRELLLSQGARIVEGRGALIDDRHVRAISADGGSEDLEADAILLATGSSPRIPDWAEVDGSRILTTRDAYSLTEAPGHVVIVGSGVTGVEFAHIFNLYGSKVTLVASRQQVLPHKDPEVAAALEDDFSRRGIEILIGARASRAGFDGEDVRVEMEDGRSVKGSHVLLAVGAVPLSEGLGLEAAGVEVGPGGFVEVNEYLQTNVGHIYAAGDLTGRALLSSVAAMQGRKVARHAMGRPVEPLDYEKVASAIFTDPEIADVGIAEADAFSTGRKVRTTKVPFASNSRALIDGDSRGFVKILSDPATGQVLGGSIVGRNAAELISVLALAVRAGLHAADLVETLNVHPALAEALSEASE